MRFCKKCGTLITKDMGVCPKCSTQNMEEAEPALEMSDDQLKKERRKSWLWILAGVPALIGFIYLLVHLMLIMKQ